MNKLKFAHLADLHLGAFREKRLTSLNFKTFRKSVDKILEEKCYFCLFAGDIFNNAMPPLEIVEQVVRELKRLQEENIPIFLIGGSHDYSNSGKSFLSLLDATGIIIYVGKIKEYDRGKFELIETKYEKLKLNICGVSGRKNQIEKSIYQNLKKPQLNKDYFNLFMFHTTIEDMLPSHLKNIKTEIRKNTLPQGFDYYAGGHIHFHNISEYFGSKISYCGPLFPNSFSELKLVEPSFNLCEFDFESRDVNIRKIILKTYEKEYLKIEILNKNPIEAKNIIESKIEECNFKDKILLLEISGIVEGKISEIEINKIIANCYNKGVFHVIKNTYKLTSANLVKVDVDTNDNIKDIEKLVIDENLKDSVDIIYERKIIQSILNLELGKLEGEKVSQYEQRIIEAFEKL